jgi:translocation and assembly module TamB
MALQTARGRRGRAAPTGRRRSGACAAVLVAVLLLLAALAAPPPAAAQDWLGGLIERLVSNQERSVRVEGFSGSLPGTARVERLTVSDREGPWLVAEGAEFRWRPLGVLSGSIAVERLAADRIEVLRTPVGDPDAPPSQGGGGLPELPLSLDLDEFRVGTLVLGEDVPGGPARLSLDGRLAYASDRVAGRLDVRRTDDRPGEARVVVDYAPAEDRLALDVVAEEPAGGVIAGALGLPGDVPVTVRVDGEGPLSAWRAEIAAEAGDRARVAGRATIDRTGGDLRAAFDVEGRVAGVLPAPVSDLVGDETRIAGTVLRGGDGRITLDAVRVDAAALQATIAGVVEPGAGRLDVGLEATLPGGGPLSDLAGADWERVVLSAQVRGPLDRPVATAAVEALSPGYGEIAAERLTAELRAEPRAPLAAGPAVVDVVLQAAAQGLRGLGEGVDAVVGDGPEIAAAAVYDGAQGAVLVEELRAVLAAATLSDGEGRADLSTGDLRLAAVAAIPDLGALEPLTSVRLAGDARLDVVATRGPEAPPTIRVEGPVAGPAIGVPAVDALLGPRADVAATVIRRPEGGWAVEDVVIEGANGRVAGDLLWAGGELAIDWRAAVPDLAPLADALGAPLAGAAEAQGRLSGPPSALALGADVRAAELAVAGTPLGPATVEARLSDLGTLAGRVSLTASPAGVPTTLAADIRREEGRFVLTGIDAGAEGVRATGALTVDPAGPAIDGRLAVAAPSLAPVGRRAGTPLRGSARADVVFEPTAGGQRIRVEAAADDVLADGTGGVESLRLAAVVADAFGAPRIDARLVADDLGAGRAELSRAVLTAEGPLGELRVAADLDGTDEFPLALDVAGVLGLRGDRNSFRLARLDGRIDEVPLSLQGPATLTWGPGGAELDRLAVASGAGALVARGALRGPRIDVDAAITGLPLDAVDGLTDQLEAEGLLDVSLRIGGTLSAPTIAFDAWSAETTIRSAAGPTLERATAEIEAAYADRRLRARAVAIGEGGLVDLTATAEIPVAVDLAAPAVRVLEAQRMTGALYGRADLSALNDFLAIRGDRAAGGAVLDLALGGTPADPRWSGEIDLDSASYEIADLGTALLGIDGRIVGDGDRISFRDVRGRTPGGGTVALDGWLRPFAPGGPQVDLTLRTEDALVARTDLVLARTDAAIDVEGGLAGLRVSGPVRLRRVEVELPDRLPAAIVDLEVMEVNRPQGVAGRIPIPRPRPDVVASTASPAGGEPAPAADDAGPLAERVALDLRVTAPNQIFVRGRGLDAELRADVGVGGTAAEPRLTGGLSLVRGRLDLAGRQIDFDRADVSFQGDGRLVPQLDVSASARSADVVARINVTGEADDPQIELASEPELPREEILARLLFDRAIGQLSAIQAAQLAQSAATLAGVGPGGPGLLGNLRRGVGLDRLGVTAGAEGDAGGGGVEAGRYVSDRVYVGVEQDFAGESRARVEVEITDTIRLESTVGPRSGTGVGVNFQWDY